MDVLKAQLARIQQQLSGLTASQKMLSAALVAIMAMTLIWWSRYAGEAELEPLLNQSFSQDDIGQITARLDSRSIRYTVTGDRIMVPSDRKIEVLADLGFAHLLPQRTNQGFDDIIKQMTPWDPADKTAHLWTEAKQRTLAAVISNFPGIREADVVIDPRDERRFDGHDVLPSAMVYITTSNRDDSTQSIRQLATAAADVIAGAEAGLSRGRVTVVVDGATIPVPDKNADDGMLDGDSIVGATRASEEMYRDKIKQLLGDISGLFVSVHVELNTKKVETQETTVDPKTSAHLSVSEEEHTVESTGSSPAGEPGASSNLTTNGGLAVGGPVSGGGGNTSSEDQTTNTYQNVISSRTEHTIQGPGDAPPVSASVRVPRSYFIGMYKDLHKGTDPDSDQTGLDALVKQELDTIRAEVKSCTGIKSDDGVTVNWYSDGVSAAGSLSAAAPTVGASPVTALLESHVRDIGVSVLAAFSLLMVMMMVRKGGGMAVAPAHADSPAAKSTPHLSHLAPDSQLAGEVAEGARTMEGMELDEESLKTQQMVDQVSSMVTENPDAAANLVKRWLNKP
jgi:flagellar biosynthesis/type III secretory pathway M-ring protein FliF/YscJ